MRTFLFLFLFSAFYLFAQQPDEIWEPHINKAGIAQYVLDDGDNFYVTIDAYGAPGVGGVIRYNKLTQEPTEMFDMGGVKAPRINHLAKDSSGTIWAAGDKGLFKFNGNGWEYIDLSDKIENYINKIDFIYCDNKDKIWMLGLSDKAHDQIGYYCNDTTFWFGNNYVDERFYIRNVKFDKFGNFWGTADKLDSQSPLIIKITPENKFEFFDNTNVSSLAETTSLSYDGVAIDTAQNVWFGAYTGLYKISPKNEIKRFEFDYGVDPTWADSLRTAPEFIFADKGDIIVIGSGNYYTAACRLRKGRWNSFKINNNLPEMLSVKQYDSLHYITLTKAGLYLINKNNFEFTEFSPKTPFDFDYFSQLAYRRDKKVEWFKVGSGSSVYIINPYLTIEMYDKGTWKSYWDYNYPITNSGYVRRAVGNEMWFAIKKPLNGAWDGVIRYDGTRWYYYSKFYGDLLGNRISTIYGDKNSNAWIGYEYLNSSASFSKFYDGKWTNYNIPLEDGANAGSVDYIYDDFLGNKWLFVTFTLVKGEDAYVTKSLGLFKMNVNDEIIRCESFSEGGTNLSTANMNTILMDPDTTLWVVALPGLTQKDSSTNWQYGLYSYKNSLWKCFAPPEIDGRSPAIGLNSISYCNDTLWLGFSKCVKFKGGQEYNLIGSLACITNTDTGNGKWTYFNYFDAEILDSNQNATHLSVFIDHVDNIVKLNDKTLMMTIQYASGTEDIEAVAFYTNGKLLIRKDMQFGCLTVGQNGDLWGSSFNNKFNPRTGRYFSNYMQISKVNYLSAKDEPTAGAQTGFTLQVYPNPARDFVSVTLSEAPIVGDFSLFDALGKSVKMGNVNRINDKTFLIDVSQLSTGVYVLSTGSGASAKIIKE